MPRAAFGNWTAGPPSTPWTKGGRLGGGGGLGLEFSIDGRAESDLALALQGALQDRIDAEMRRLRLAYAGAMTRFVDAGKARLRADVAAGGFYRAERLSKTWRAASYPRPGKSLDVAGWFKTKARVLIEAFDEGVTIRAKDGNFLAIPLGPAKAIVRRLNSFKQRGSRSGGPGRDAFGKYTKDDNNLSRVAQALGVELVPIINRATGRGVLVAASGLRLTKTGRSAKSQAGQATALFALVKVATLKKRIRGRALLAELENSFPGVFAGYLAAELGAEETA